jgi:hypothetical protein
MEYRRTEFKMGGDARVDRRRGKNWSYSFKLVMSKKRGAHSFLVLQDQGTYGLTGRVLRPDELEADLPVEERWGRFENLAFNWDYSLVAPVFHYCFNSIPDLRTRLTARRIALITHP